jgi:hypothetical protein
VLSKTLEGILNPDDVGLSDLPDSPWNWDRETRIKAQCLLSTINTAMFIVAFITVKNFRKETKISTIHIKTLTKLKNQYLNYVIGSMKNSLFGSMMPK